MKKKTNWLNVIKWMSIYGLFVALGFIAGMGYQQILFVQGATHILNFADIEVNVDFNATKFTEELNKTFIPAWKQAFNETVHNQLNLSESTDKAGGKNGT